jgi:hypothetical protein
VRKDRNRVLRELAAVKNRTFRDRMTGRTLSAVTLHEPSTALSHNYLKILLSAPREPNMILDIRIGGSGDTELTETVK